VRGQSRCWTSERRCINIRGLTGRLVAVPDLVCLCVARSNTCVCQYTLLSRVEALATRSATEVMLRRDYSEDCLSLPPVPRSAALMGHRLLWSTPWLQLDDSAALLPTPVRQRSRSVIVASLTSPKSSSASLPPTTSSHYLAPLQYDPVHPLHPRPRSVLSLSDPASHELTCLPHTLPGPNGSYSPLRLSRRPTDAAAQL
jgi:hypothetical protein